MIINQTGGAGGIEWKPVNLALKWKNPISLSLSDTKGEIQPGRQIPINEWGAKIDNSLAIADVMAPDGGNVSLIYGKVAPIDPLTVSSYKVSQMYSVTELNRAFGARIASAWKDAFPVTFTGKGKITICLYRAYVSGHEPTLIDLNLDITEGIVNVYADLPAYANAYGADAVYMYIVGVTISV